MHRRPPSSSSMANAVPLRRSDTLFKSQIPIRVNCGTEQRSRIHHQALLRAQAFERHRQSWLSTPQPFALQVMRTLSSSSAGPTTGQHQQQQPIETAFRVYQDRLHTDLVDFRAMCSRLISQEIKEKEKWHTLCLKIMNERDTARQRVSALIREREARLSSSSSSSSSSSTSSSAKENVSSKRARDETTSSPSQEDNAQELPPAQSSPVESRPIRSLRSSTSPTPSSPASPSASLHNSSSTPIHSSSLPFTSSPPPPPLPPNSNITVPPTPLTPSSSPHDIMTFNPSRSPNDQTCFDVSGVIDIADIRPMKRHKSYDSSSSLSEINKTVQNVKDEDVIIPQCPGEKTKSKKDAEPSGIPRPFLIAHTDIMYMPMKGRLFCRACL